MDGAIRKKDSTVWARDPHDWYREPNWCSERLFDEEPFRGNILDPAAGSGAIVKSAIIKGYHAEGSDLVLRNTGLVVERDWLAPCDRSWDNIVSNPPFGLCDDRRTGTFPFVERCLERAHRKVALLLPAKWIQGDARSRWLETTPLRRVWFLSPRPSMPPGRVLEAGGKPGNGTADFCWMIWQHDYDGPAEIRWLRKAP